MADATKQFKLTELHKQELVAIFLEKHAKDPYLVCLHSNEYTADPWQRYEVLLCCGARRTFKYDINFSWIALKNFLQQNAGSWIFGHIAYEALSEIEEVGPELPLFIDLPKIEFFVPEVVFSIANGLLTIEQNFIGYDYLSVIFSTKLLRSLHPTMRPGQVNGTDRELYLRHINELQRQIREGNIYEINYCHSTRMRDLKLKPVRTWQALNAYSRAPFSALYRTGAFALCCASPERFVARRGDELICQPIKGTNRRLADPAENARQMDLLRDSEKERAENIMIVDLMRNDLGRICQPGSIRVPELCGVYPFAHVNQMISTVTGQVTPNTSVVEVMQALFPPGSMTGAPKVSAMQWITATESHQRGLYSGTVGYIRPDGDFDFNVVIRAIQMDTRNGNASVWAGGAITSLSDPEAEYEESLLKMESLLSFFNLTGK